MISITKALFEYVPPQQIIQPGSGGQMVQHNPAPNVTKATKGLVKPFTNTGALAAPAGVPQVQVAKAPMATQPQMATAVQAAPVQVARAPIIVQPPPATVTAAGNAVATGPEAVKSDLIAQNAEAKAKVVQHNISGPQATGELLRRGGQAAGEAAGSFGKKVAEFAHENPLTAGAIGGAGLLYGTGKVFNRNKSA